MMATECTCFSSPNAQRILLGVLGMYDRFAEAAILVCPACGQLWLRLHQEDEAFSASGRWYLGAIEADQARELTAQGARAALEELEWYYYGGSYYDGRSGKTSGSIP
jgi:hypothetical protein